MPDVLYVFRLPEENMEFQEFLDGHKYKWVIDHVWSKLKEKTKHGDPTDEEREVYEEVRGWIADACQDESIEVP